MAYNRTLGQVGVLTCALIFYDYIASGHRAPQKRHDGSQFMRLT